MDPSIAVVLLLAVSLNVEAAVVPLPNCNHDEYVGGTIRNPVCKKCLMCEPGYGLNNWCNNNVRFPMDNFECIPCTNGTFSAYNSYGMCDECVQECSHNEVETQQCLPTKNRLCECKAGIFVHGANGQCNQECCHCSHGLGVVKKCQKDNIGGRLCEPPGTSGKCPALHITLPGTTDSKNTSTSTKMVKTVWSSTKRITTVWPSTKRTTTTWLSTKVIKTAQHSTKMMTSPNYTIPESISGTIKLKGVAYWLYAFPGVVLLALMLGYFWSTRNCNICQQRNTEQNGSNDADYIWMEDLSDNSSNVNASDTMSPHSSEAPLVSKTAPPVPTSARPSVSFLKHDI